MFVTITTDGNNMIHLAPLENPGEVHLIIDDVQGGKLCLIIKNPYGFLSQLRSLIIMEQDLPDPPGHDLPRKKGE